MVKQVREILTESERNRIKGLHNMQNTDDFVIVDWLSPDEKYCIFLDELYDIENKTKIGDIWENFDNFKFFLKHSFEVAKNVPQEIKEDVLTSIDKLVLTESTQDLRMLKPYVKQMLMEDNIFSDAWNWGKKQVKSAVQGVKDFAVNAWDGLKKTYNYIADGDWKSAFSIIAKGALWVARKIRSALYHPIGLILDAILVATGIGKSVQFVIWAVVVALDIYELISGDYEDPNLSMIWRLIFLGVDIMGLVFAGAAAKGAKGIVGEFIRKFGSTTEGLAKSVKESSALKGILEKILSASKSAEGVMGKAAGYLEKNAPKIYKFFSGTFSALGKFVNKMVDGISAVLGVGGKVLSAPGKLASKLVGGGKAGAAANALVTTTGAVYGFEKLAGGSEGGEDNSAEYASKIEFKDAQVDFSGGL